MKIAYVVDSWPRLSETFVVREIAAAARRHDVRILALGPGDARADDPEAAALTPRVSVLPSGSGAGVRALPRLLGHPGRALRATRAAWRARGERTLRRLPALVLEAEALRAWGVERVHAHFARWATAAAEVVAAWADVPFGFTAHAYDLFKSPYRLDDKARRAAWAVTCTEAGLEEVRRRHGDGVAARFRVLRHGLDLDAWRPVARAPRPAGAPLRVVAVGRLVPKKGFDVLLEAMALLPGAGVAATLRLVGGGDEAEALAERARRLGLDPVVTLAGSLPPPAVRDAIALEADVVAVPSRVAPDGDRDGLPNVVGEAMACGVPVVGTPVGGVLEMLEDGATGLVVPSEDPAALAAALARLAEDPALRERLGRGARARAEAVFDGRRNVEALLAWIEAGGGPGRA